MRFVVIGIVIIAVFVFQQLPFAPERPAQAHKLTVKEMCRGPNRPDWCTELYADLAHGREAKEKPKGRDKKVEEIRPLDEVEQSYMEDSR